MFSIVIPTIGSRHLHTAVDSALTQTYPAVEVIVVDNGPFSITKEVEKTLSIKGAKIIRHDSQKDILDNWNACLNYASAEYFILLCDDDWMESNCLQQYSELIHKHPGIAVLHSRTNITQNERLLYTSPNLNEIETASEYIYHTLIKNRFQMVSDFAYRRQSLLEVGGYQRIQGYWASDEATTYRAAINSGKVAFGRKPTVNYRLSEENFTATVRAESILRSSIDFTKWCMKNLVPSLATCDDQIHTSLISKAIHRKLRDRQASAISHYLQENGTGELYRFMTREMSRGDVDLRSILRGVISAYTKISVNCVRNITIPKHAAK